MKSEDIKALDYLVDFSANHATSHASVVRRIASVGKLRIGSLHPMLEDSPTAEHYVCMGHAFTMLTRIAVNHGLGVDMRDGALVMVKDTVPPTAPQKTNGRPRRIALSPLEEQVGKFMCHARRRNNGHLADRELERLAKLLDEAGEPLTEALRNRSRQEGREVHRWQDAVKRTSGVRHDVIKYNSRTHRNYLRVHPPRVKGVGD